MQKDRIPLNAKEFGNWIIARRQARGWSRGELAYQSGVSDQTLRNIEGGYQAAGPKSRAAILQALGYEEDAAIAQLRSGLDEPIPYMHAENKDMAAIPAGIRAFGQWVKAQRVHRRWHRDDLARRTGLSARTLKNIEGGYQKAGTRARRAIMEAFGMAERPRVPDLKSPASPGVPHVERPPPNLIGRVLDVVCDPDAREAMQKVRAALGVSDRRAWEIVVTERIG